MSYPQMAPPAPPPAPLPPSTEAIKPGRRWYWIGGVLIALGVAAAVALFAVWAVRTSNTVDDFARVRVPPEGATTGLVFKKAGNYTIYYEWRSEVTENGTTQRVDNSSHNPPSQLSIVITSADGKPVPTQPEDEDITFSFNDKIGRAVRKVNIPAPGAYVMRVTSNATEPFVIAIGKGIIHTIVPYALIGIGAFLLGLILGLVAIIVTGVKRGRRKRERRAAEQGALGGYAAPAAAYAGDGSVPPPEGWSPPPADTPAPPAWDAPPPPAPAPEPPEPSEPSEPSAPPSTPMPAPAPPPPPAPGPGSSPPWGPPGS
jgi:hypothetical protein